MHPGIQVVHDEKRGCGWRKPGGLYLCGDNPAKACGRMPVPIGTCPCCGNAAISKPARGLTWVDADRLLAEAPPCKAPKRQCRLCPLEDMLKKGVGRAGLIWVGEIFYPTVRDFEREADRLGISRRLAAVPHDFVVGESLILLAHRKAVMWQPPEMGSPPKFAPGIFRVWKPSRIEVIVTGDEPDEVIEGYLKRGLTPVKVVRQQITQEELG